MNIKFFNQSVSTIKELKQAYRKLAKQFHPDLNEHDTTEQMKQINKEYEYLFATVETTKDNKEGHTVNDNYRSIINQLLKHEGITINLIGTWIWLEGNTYPIKDEIKKLGFRFQRSSKKWYLGEFDTKKKKGKLSWNQKIEKYGQEQLHSKGNKPFQLT
ncbi:hypothetical protein CIL05_06990 [Virgibacillus profundi]|uniref:J domain-containing protein n=1 Tax=Virgibacillus profundi TaxID=2024555 RepID=A0A2A2IGE3_9BACI|nr:DnaJ domain-containing protein [Virgibacillus profundi]PAV30205.1 hypothetical protein CIL05_06990 [Virgibacillus profundi]PXY54377.1 molecular chaperone DnaJ [Virgibacillus profundi]